MAGNTVEFDSRTQLKLTTFGVVALHVSRAGENPVLVSLVGKQLGLVAYLACAPGRRASREHLIDMFWGNQGRDVLRDLLRQVKQKIGDECFGQPGADPVALVATVECDRDLLVAAHERSDHQGVIELYAGEFLPGLETLQAGEFGDWVDGERERLRRIFVHSAREQVRQHLASSRPREGLRIARRLRDEDESGEASWRLLLQCLIVLGDHVAVAIEAERLQRLLAEQSLEPEAATLALLAQAHAAAVGATQDGASAAEANLVADLVGREGEFSAILRSWHESRTGSLRCVQLVAAAGFGKSRLLAEVRTRLHTLRAREERARSAHARANYGAREFPLAFAGDFARALLERRGGAADRPRAVEIPEWAVRALVSINPSLSEFFPAAASDASAGDGMHDRLALALYELLKGVAAEGPLAIFLDDLHWCHRDSINVLATTLGKAERLPVLVVSAARIPCDHLCAAGNNRRIPLPPLTVESTAALLSNLASFPSSPWSGRLTQALVDATGGSPLLILETLHLMLEQGLIERSADGWAVADPAALFETLARGSAVRRRVESLEPLERWLLLLLAASGLPLDKEALAAAAGHSPGELDPALERLEQRGLIMRWGNEWTPGHDEHAAAVLDIEAPEARRRAADRVGRALVEFRSPDVRQLRLAAPLLARGGEESRSALESAFGTFVRAERLGGERRSDRALARELLGGEATEALIASMVHSLPGLLRLRLFSALRIAVAAAALFLILGTAGLVMLRPPPDRAQAVLMAVWRAQDDSTVHLLDVPIDEERWNEPGAFLLVDIARRAPWRMNAAMRMTMAGLRPDGQGWAVTRAVPDSEGLEIFDVGLDGRVHRMTFSSRDDMDPAWSPDQKQLAFVTGRWNDGEEYDIAVRDLLTGNDRPLTSGEDWDVQPSWSPDGSRIAFRRDHAVGGRALCVIHVDGESLRCRSGSINGVLGWSDALHVIVEHAAHKTVRLVKIDVETWGEELLEGDSNTGSVSPDGRWVVCQCTRPGHPARSWILYRVDRPTDFRVLRVVGDRTEADVRFDWAPTTPRAPFLADLQIIGGQGPPLVGMSYVLRAIGTDSAGRSIAPSGLRWRSLDTAVAVVDENGVLEPRRPGPVQVEVSAGGWRQTTSELVITAPIERLLFEESWTDGFSSAWRLFGEPRPITVESERLGPAFTNNGDRYYFSGAYTANSFDARGGVWVEATMSMPLTDGRWQEQNLRLFAIRDSTRWAAWDHRTGDAAGFHRCTVHLFTGSGSSIADSLSVEGPGGVSGLPAPPWLRTGRPFNVLVQIFPDGRCGFALDGTPLRVTRPGQTTAAARVMVDGRSVDTRILVGPLRVLTGIAPHVDWARVDSIRR